MKTPLLSSMLTVSLPPPAWTSILSNWLLSNASSCWEPESTTSVFGSPERRPSVSVSAAGVPVTVSVPFWIFPVTAACLAARVPGYARPPAYALPVVTDATATAAAAIGRNLCQCMALLLLDG